MSQAKFIELTVISGEDSLQFCRLPHSWGYNLLHMSYEFILCMLKLVLSRKKKARTSHLQTSCGSEIAFIAPKNRSRPVWHDSSDAPNLAMLVKMGWYPKGFSGNLCSEIHSVRHSSFWKRHFGAGFPMIFQLYSQSIAMIFPWYLGFCEKFCTSLPAPDLLPASACRGAGTEWLKIFVAALKNLWWCGFWGGRRWRWGPRMA